jgi:hypothetical protein
MAIVFEPVVNFGAQLGGEWVPFTDGYRWLPYAGSKNVW